MARTPETAHQPAHQMCSAPWAHGFQPGSNTGVITEVTRYAAVKHKAVLLLCSTTIMLYYYYAVKLRPSWIPG